MANSDTIIALTGPGTGRNQINTLTLTATTETVFSTTFDNGTTGPAVLTIPTGSATDASGKPLLVGSGSPIEFNLSSAVSQQSYGRKDSVGTSAPFYTAKTFDGGRPFRLRIVGQATLNAGTGNTLALNIYQGTSATVGSDVKIAAIGAGGAPSTSFNFVAEVFVQFDNTSQTLGGYYVGQVGNTFTAQHALTNAASVTSVTGLNFVVSAVYGNAGGGSTYISEFSAEQV
jgi:hypothetical protein